jgi:hypothetical protein
VALTTVGCERPDKAPNNSAQGSTSKGKTKVPQPPLVTVPPGHWARPIPVRDEPPASWSTIEKSLLPKDCGTCHPAQLADWQTTLHSKAMSPGLIGQIIAKDRPSFTKSCYHCHAPMTEQLKKIKSGKEWVTNENYNEELRNMGVGCVVCHLRNNKVHGPPPKDGNARDMSALPHGGFEIEPDFQSAKFCSACHQFPASWNQLNGKLLENTYEEWKASPAAKEGKTCQSCHMPDRRHLFKGIHDPEMTRSAFEFTSEVTVTDAGISAVATLKNVGAGHMAPTYVTPRITIQFQQLDSAGNAVGKPSEPTIIQRHISLGEGNDREIFDTRLAPGASATAEWKTKKAATATHVRVEVRCIPDHYYEEFYKRLLKRYPSGSEQHKLITQALAEAEANHFTVFEKSQTL